MLIDGSVTLVAQFYLLNYMVSSIPQKNRLKNSCLKPIFQFNIWLPINGALMSSLELDPPPLSPGPEARNFCKLKDFLWEPPLYRKC